MDKYIEILKKNGYDNKIIEIVKNSILIAEEFISTPKSTKINGEIVRIVNQIYKNDN